MLKYFEKQNFKPEKKKLPYWVWIIFVAAILFIFIFSNNILSMFNLISGYMTQIFLISMIGIIATEVILVFQLVKTGNKDEYNKDMMMLFTVIQIVLLFFQAMILLNQNVIQTQQKDILKQTSSPRYANIDFTLSQYVGNTAYFPISNINNKKQFNISKDNIGINIINTGQLNTGEIQLSQRYSDNNLFFDTLNVGDINSKSNKAFWINFTVTNYTNLIGEHRVNLTVFCPNCFEQGTKGLMTDEVVLCFYNDSKYSGSEGWNEVVRNGCKN
jgi:hypothetical protein